MRPSQTDLKIVKKFYVLELRRKLIFVYSEKLFGARICKPLLLFQKVSPLRCFSYDFPVNSTLPYSIGLSVNAEWHSDCITSSGNGIFLTEFKRSCENIPGLFIESTRIRFRLHWLNEEWHSVCPESAQNDQNIQYSGQTKILERIKVNIKLMAIHVSAWVDKKIQTKIIMLCTCMLGNLRTFSIIFQSTTLRS